MELSAQIHMHPRREFMQLSAPSRRGERLGSLDCMAYITFPLPPPRQHYLHYVKKRTLKIHAPSNTIGPHQSWFLYLQIHLQLHNVQLQNQYLQHPLVIHGHVQSGKKSESAHAASPAEVEHGDVLHSCFSPRTVHTVISIIYLVPCCLHLCAFCQRFHQ